MTIITPMLDDLDELLYDRSPLDDLPCQECTQIAGELVLCTGECDRVLDEAMARRTQVGCYFCVLVDQRTLPDDQLPQRTVVSERRGGGHVPHMILTLACGHEVI